mgnify:CR=1 FL=1
MNIRISTGSTESLVGYQSNVTRKPLMSGSTSTLKSWTLPLETVTTGSMPLLFLVLLLAYLLALWLDRRSKAG